MSECAKPDWHDCCCCNCVNHVRVNKHPWNKGEGKGAITEHMGWVCIAFANEDSAIFFDHDHGMCEMHTKRKSAPSHA